MGGVTVTAPKKSSVSGSFFVDGNTSPVTVPTPRNQKVSYLAV